MSNEIKLSADALRTLTDENSRARLRKAIEVAKNNPQRIVFAVIRAIADLKNPSDLARYQFLDKQLRRLVANHIKTLKRREKTASEMRSARKDRAVDKLAHNSEVDSSVPKKRVSRRILKDAEAHERRMLLRIPEHDR